LLNDFSNTFTDFPLMGEQRTLAVLLNLETYGQHDITVSKCTLLLYILWLLDWNGIIKIPTPGTGLEAIGASQYSVETFCVY